MTRNSMDDHWQTWLSSQAKFTHAFTFNLYGFHPVYRCPNSRELATQTGRRFLSHLARNLFGRRYRHGHRKLSGIVSLERGCKGDLWHLHGALECPTGFDPIDFEVALKLVVSQMDWALGNVDIRQYQSSGWLRYISKTGLDSVVALDLAR